MILHPIELRERHGILTDQIRTLLDAAHCMMLSATQGEAQIKQAKRLIDEAAERLKGLGTRLGA